MSPSMLPFAEAAGTVVLPGAATNGDHWSRAPAERASGPSAACYGMHMSVLTRRTQLLLDEERYRRLQQEADATGRSVAAIIRDAIDARLEEVDRGQQRRTAWQGLLDQSAPKYEREPDWDDVKDDLYDARWRRMYPREP